MVVKPTMSLVGADAARNLRAELEENARRVGVGIGDVERLVGLEVADVGETI